MKESNEMDTAKLYADYLRGRNGMKVRHAVEYGKRVEYFKGDKLVSFIMENSVKWKKCPAVNTNADALKVGEMLIDYGFIHRSDRDPKNKKLLTPSKDRSFGVNGYYTWMYDGPKTLRHIMTACLIGGIAVITCFPIWPGWAKVAIWYLSVTLLIFIFVFSFLRLIAFMVMWMLGYDFWFLPNVFDDNLSVADSFKPLYSFSETEKGERIYRAAGIVAFVVFCIWVHNQPTDFDDYMNFTKQFTEDIYSGKMISDMSQKQKDNIDKVHVPNLEDLIKEEDEDIEGSGDMEADIIDKLVEKDEVDELDE